MAEGDREQAANAGGVKPRRAVTLSAVLLPRVDYPSYLSSKSSIPHPSTRDSR